MIAAWVGIQSIQLLHKKRIETGASCFRCSIEVEISAHVRNLDLSDNQRKINSFSGNLSFHVDFQKESIITLELVLANPCETLEWFLWIFHSLNNMLKMYVYFIIPFTKKFLKKCDKLKFLLKFFSHPVIQISIKIIYLFIYLSPNFYSPFQLFSLFWSNDLIEN